MKEQKTISDISIPLPMVGDRFELVSEVDRYPNFSVKEGSKGTIVRSDEFIIALEMDEFISGAEEWKNCIEWFENDGHYGLGYFWPDVKPIKL
jgi:hypothetical protein